MEKEMIKREMVLSKEAWMSYFQISLLIVGMFAFSYVAGEVFGDTDNLLQDEISDSSFSLLGRLDNFGDIFEVKGVGLVSAQVGGGCCEETKDGQTCQEVPQDQCDSGFIPTSCESTGSCQLGCCISPTKGLCSEGTPKIVCENGGGEFKNDEACNIQECRKGCCVVGSESFFTTEANCQWEGNTQNRDLPTDWRPDITSDYQCRFLTEKNKEGACLYESEGEKRCLLTSLDECFSRTGSVANFVKDKFCSDPELDTICKAKDHKTCIAGEEDVYWFDSCGNKEDIAEDCDFYRGSYCKLAGGKASCEDIRCDTNGDGLKDRANGESWCSYDGKIGEGKDTVGSRHVKHICYLGTERIAACSDFRNEICVQEDVDLDGKKFSQAACRVNRWRECVDFNNIENVESMVKKCEANVDCKVKHIDMTKGKGDFKFSVCLPNYPPGLDLLRDDLYNEDGSLTDAYNRATPTDNICGGASQTCTEDWVWTLFGPICISNCDCHSSSFTKEMNDFCTSLGDCGAYTNYIGDTTDTAYMVSSDGHVKPPRISAAVFGHSKNANAYTGPPAPPGDFGFFATLNPELLPASMPDGKITEGNLSAFQRELLSSAGAFGSPLLLKVLTEDSNASSVAGAVISTGIMGLARFTGATSSVKAGIAAQIAGTKKEKDFSSMIGAMIAGLIGGIIGQMMAGTIGAMIGGLLGFLFFLAIPFTIDIKFTCSLWDPPDGGAKCNECNKLGVPCTEYRCESLGQLCRLINKGSKNELCKAKPSNETFPVIKPFEAVISEGYEYSNVNPDGFSVVNKTDQGCLEPYTSVDIGIKVEPFAKCRVGTDPRDKYEEMSEIFGPKGNYVLPAHLTRLFFPSPEAFKNVYNLTEEQIREMGENDLYVKCKTGSGRVNPNPFEIKTCIRPGPDLTAPLIGITTPKTGTYIQYGIEEQEVVFYVNEPSECKWNLEDQEFDDMENQMECETNPVKYELFGLPCSATLTGLNENDKFYFKCRDLSENSNTMSESFVFELQNSLTELKIDEVIPKRGSIITSSVEPASAVLKLSTSGGVDGKAICNWTGNGFEDSFRYNEIDGSQIHEYSLTRLSRGRWNINFMCADRAGNNAESSTFFDVRIDSFGPRIVRIYFENGLKVVTSESAECKYSFDRNFNFDEATGMGSDGLNHFAGWASKTYHVQCKDDFGNKGRRIRIKPSV